MESHETKTLLYSKECNHDGKEEERENSFFFFYQIYILERVTV